MKPFHRFIPAVVKAVSNSISSILGADKIRDKKSFITYQQEHKAVRSRR